MNRINNKLKQNKKLLSIYFTAGYPNLDNTAAIIQNLEKSGVDFIEIGLPFSDPLADGLTIQASSTQALKNGMTFLSTKSYSRNGFNSAYNNGLF